LEDGICGFWEKTVVEKKIRVINIKKNPELVRDPGYCYIGRGSIYGNPFSHIDMSTALVKVETREEAIENHKKWLNGEIKLETDPPTREEIMMLKNKKFLGCFCAPLKCHGDTYVKIIEGKDKKEEFKSKNLF